jgi:mRNA interferase RelE/StbE
MTVAVDRSFEKDTNRIHSKTLLNRVADCIEEVQRAETIHQVRNVKKLKGGLTYYRIRIGDYRIGLTVENNIATFVRFLHRKEIYDYFP